MFGSSKNTTKAPAGTEPQTGTERAKLERAGAARLLTVDDVLITSSETPAAANPVDPKRGAQMPDKPTSDPQDSAHLYIGAGVKLKGELSGCELLRVEGTFEGTAQARKLILCPGGLLLGTALIDDAEVEGSFDGALHVRGRLFLRNKGHIAGQFSYGQLEIERGGLIDGKVTPFDKKADKPQAAPTAKPAEAGPPKVAAASPGAPSPGPAAQPPKPGLAAVAQALPSQPAKAAAEVTGPGSPATGGAQPLNGSRPLNGSGPGTPG